MIAPVRIACLLILTLLAVGSPALAQKEAGDSKRTDEKPAQVDKKVGEKKSAGQTKASKKDKEKEQQDNKKDKEQEKKLAQLRQIDIAGSYVDLVQPISFDPSALLLGGNPLKQRSFFKLCEFLDKLCDNERVSYVLFDLSDSGVIMNSAQLDELTRHINKLRDAGKKSFAWLENASNVHLAIAACCDEVIMADFGGIDMPSLAMQSMFYADAMDLLGVKASVVRAGDFKGAVEPYVNAKMSSHLREHYQAMLQSMNDAQVDRIARGRGVKSSAVRELQKKRMLLPDEAKQKGMVDQLAPYGSMKQAIEKEIDEEVEWITPKVAAKKQVSMFQLMGQMMAGPQGSSRIRDNTIAVIHLSGAIVDGKKASPGSIVSGPTVAMIESLTEEDKVKAAVIRINSPGGSATASEAVRQALVKLAKKKPTVVSMGHMAASGGYWVSCIDAPIYAEKGTLTGSIGVFSMKLSAGALLRRVGVHLEAITLDDSAGLFSLDRTWSDEDNEMLQGTIDLVYDRFLDLVSDARGMEVDELKAIAGGRVWSGSQAKRRGLVDELGGLDDCLTVVAKQAKLDDYKVAHRPIPRSGLDLSELFSSGGEEEIWGGVSQVALRLLQQRGISLQMTEMLLTDGFTNTGKPTVWLMNPCEFTIGWQ